MTGWSALSRVQSSDGQQKKVKEGRRSAVEHEILGSTVKPAVTSDDIKKVYAWSCATSDPKDVRASAATLLSHAALLRVSEVSIRLDMIARFDVGVRHNGL